jgi:hypothetical protein
MSLVGLLVAILVFSCLWYLVSLLPDARLQKIARIVLIVLAIIWLLDAFSLFGPAPFIRIR